MGGHHGPELPKVPDWRIYRVEDVPELMKVKHALRCHGLSDPWLRNEVWRFTGYKKTAFQTFNEIVFRGFKYGLAAAIVTTAIDYAIFPLRKAPGEAEFGHH